MRLSNLRWVTKVGLTAAVLVLAACSEQPTSSAGDPSFHRSGGRNGGQRGRLHRGGERYRDTGRRPAHGRSGSAAIGAEALFQGDGTTLLTVTSYRASDTEFLSPVGCIEKVQVKAFRVDGKLLYVRNFNNLDAGSSYAASLTGVGPGNELQVTAHVKCIDRRRTDVVTAFPIVRFAPDPAVTVLSLPSMAVVGLPALVRATVSERNGDKGVTGTCRLFVDGSTVGSIDNVWVDAAGTVDCAFAYSFPAAGTRQIEVRFDGATPADFDLTNNSRTGSLDVATSVPPPTDTTTPPEILQPFVLSANVWDDDVVSDDVVGHSYRLASDPSVLLDTLRWAWTINGVEQGAQLNGIIYETIPFPLARVAVSQTSGTTRYHEMDLPDVAATGTGNGGYPSYSYDDIDGVHLRIISEGPSGTFPFGMTSVTYWRTASSATYVDERYVATFDGQALVECPAGAGCYYLEEPAGPALTRYGSSYAFSVLVEAGSRRYSVTASTPLTVSPISIIQPLACVFGTVEWYLGLQKVTAISQNCEGLLETRTSKSGSIADLVGLTEVVP